MDVTLHLCGPKGDGQRLLLDRALAMLQADNEYLFQAMLRGGRPIPDKIEDLGLRYRDDTIIDPHSPRQHYYGFRQMLENGTFSCGDASAFEAAVLVIKYQMEATAFSQARAPGIFHAVYRTQAGVVDPIARLHGAGQGGVAV